MQVSHRHLFRLPSDVSYLNCAYMSPQLKSVEAVGIAEVSKKCLPFEIGVEDFFTPVRALKANFAQLINASDTDRIALIPSVSYGIANVARNVTLKPGQKILLAAEQFPSNVYPWLNVAKAQKGLVQFVGPKDSTRRTESWNEAFLEAIDEQTALIALSHVHWADGTVFDLPAIRKAADAVGALLIIDATQSLGALPFDLKQIRPDALIVAGYKWLMGPYSLGLGYYGPAFDGGKPIEENWINRKDAADFKNLVNYQPAYESIGSQYSVGEHSNFILVPMLNRALEQILDWGPANIQEYCQSIANDALDALHEMGVALEASTNRAHHMFGLRLPKGFPIEALKKQFQQHQVYVSFRGTAIRISPHLYNESQDFERLVTCFQQSLVLG